MKHYRIGDLAHSTTPCKICHSHTLRIIALKGRHYQELTTVICTGCGLVRSHPIPTEEELLEYYRSQYRRDYRSAVTPKRKHIVRYSKTATERLRRLRPFVAPNSILIDVGCGSGEFLYAAQLAGYQVCGIEPHEGYSEYTRRIFDVPVLTSHFQDAEISPETVDVITLHHVLEHLQHPLTALIHISGWLKHGGILMVDVPNIEHSSHSPINRFHYAHIYNFNYPTLVAFLSKAGFELVDHPSNKQGTSLAAQKVRKADYDATIPILENYKTLWDMFMQGNNAPQYAHKHPVQRAIRKQWRYFGEYLTGVWFYRPNKIVGHFYRKSFDRTGDSDSK